MLLKCTITEVRLGEWASAKRSHHRSLFQIYEIDIFLTSTVWPNIMFQQKRLICCFVVCQIFFKQKLYTGTGILLQNNVKKLPQELQHQNPKFRAFVSFFSSNIDPPLNCQRTMRGRMEDNFGTPCTM